MLNNLAIFLQLTTMQVISTCMVTLASPQYRACAKP